MAIDPSKLFNSDEWIQFKKDASQFWESTRSLGKTVVIHVMAKTSSSSHEASTETAPQKKQVKKKGAAENSSRPDRRASGKDDQMSASANVPRSQH